jgi:hypothetical protein
MKEEMINWKIRVKIGEKEIEVVGMAFEPTKKLFKEIEHYLD